MALEIERKFLVLDSSYKHEAFASSHIRQGYICSDRGRTVRIRIRDEHAYITIKGPSLDGGLSRYEFEQEIPMDDAEKLLTLCEPGTLRRTDFTPFHRKRGHRRPSLLQQPVTLSPLLHMARLNEW